ncbi:hypothetical protein [Streptomyces sp. NPDC048057]|uniref:hypothetical protein n=1 Tax=Streptomyces sp. NPDC048057 TaxID=3155628 RepID=UPI0033C34EC6
MEAESKKQDEFDPGVWRNTPLREVPGVGPSNHQLRIHFGGRGGIRSKAPAEPVVLAGVSYTGEGRYEVWDADSRDVLLNCTLASRVWWAPARAVLKRVEP